MEDNDAVKPTGYVLSDINEKIVAAIVLKGIHEKSVDLIIIIII